MDLSVLPECYVDTCLIETLVPPKTHYNHQKGTGTVAKKMKEHFHDRFAVGIVDKDKRKLHYLEEFALILSKDDIELYKHKQKHHYLILINPAIERFILKNAAAAGLSLPDYDLPEALDELRKVSKSVNSKNDPRFKLLFGEMLKNKPSEILLLISLLTYLLENNYKSDIARLKAMPDNI
jgi:hypothetical protein